MDYSLIGKRIRKYREAKGMTQVALAEASGLSDRAISSIELARKRVQLDSLLRIASALSVNPDAILLGANSDNNDLCALEFTTLLGNCSPQDRHLILEISEQLARRLSQ